MAARIALIFGLLITHACAFDAGQESEKTYGIMHPAGAGDAGPQETYQLPYGCIPVEPNEHPTWFVCWERLGQTTPGDPAPLPGDPEKR